MRLDAVISSIFSVSRSAACDAINGGLVGVNGIAVIKPDRTVNEGDKLSLRGKGKAIIDSVGGFSKKGRIRFSYRRYR
jgi:RNA-binding protein YlmH